LRSSWRRAVAPKFQQLHELKLEDLVGRGKRVERFTITDFSFGDCYGRAGPGAGIPVYVKGGIPGQEVSGRVAKVKRGDDKQITSILLSSARVLKHSPVESEDEYMYQASAGALLGRVPIGIQQQWKADAVMQTLSCPEHGLTTARLWDMLDEIMPSPLTWHYRNRMEYTFGAKFMTEADMGKEAEPFGLGFNRRGVWFKVQNVDRDCGLFDKQVEDNLWQLREWCKSTGLACFLQGRKGAPHSGFFQGLAVRKSFATEQLSFSLKVSAEHMGQFDEQGFVEEVCRLFGDRVAGIWLYINDNKGGDRPAAMLASRRVLYGESFVREKIGNQWYHSEGVGFTQPNPLCAAKLYSKVCDYVSAGIENQLQKNPTGTIRVLDLYCGPGAIALQVAERLKGVEGSLQVEISGVEMESLGVASARANLERNERLLGGANISFELSSVENYVKRLHAMPVQQQRSGIDVAIVNPPRAGLHTKKVRHFLRDEAAPNTLVYVSCNPESLKVDLEVLLARYEVKDVCIVDQFPHTSHVETIVRLQRLPQFTGSSEKELKVMMSSTL
jgi:23S rRNA (uracil1939-C5)-methyltransferase